MRSLKYLKYKDEYPTMLYNYALQKDDFCLS